MKVPLIYIVDDDLISKYEIEMRLRQSEEPCSIVSFGDTDSTFAMLDSNFGHEQGLPNIIIVNFNLPGIDGLSFLKAIESNSLITDETALYIFSTSKISEERKNYEGVEQIKGFFRKPLSKKDIQKIFNDYKKSVKGNCVP